MKHKVANGMRMFAEKVTLLQYQQDHRSLDTTIDKIPLSFKRNTTYESVVPYIDTTFNASLSESLWKGDRTYSFDLRSE